MIEIMNSFIEMFIDKTIHRVMTRSGANQCVCASMYRDSRQRIFSVFVVSEIYCIFLIKLIDFVFFIDIKSTDLLVALWLLLTNFAVYSMGTIFFYVTIKDFCLFLLFVAVAVMLNGCAIEC